MINFSEFDSEVVENERKAEDKRAYVHPQHIYSFQFNIFGGLLNGCNTREHFPLDSLEEGAAAG